MADSRQHSPSGIQEALLMIPKFGTGVGLHRMLELCEPLAYWMKNVDAIKVTGSNGKGSTSAMVASVLTNVSVSTGLYISPHLRTFNERISIDGRLISDAKLAEAFEWFNRRRHEYESKFPGDAVGAFEAFTAMALYYFSRQRPRTLVSEAGIGGRYDSTRIIKGGVVGLTSLDFEHTSLLGNSLEMIAYDKADLCEAGGTIVTGISDPDILRRLRAFCALRQIELRCAMDVTEVTGVSFGENYMELNLEMDGISLPGLRVALQGFHQVTNLRVAVVLLQEWLKRHEAMLPGKKLENAIRKGMCSLSWSGRFERIRRSPDVFIDVGHSPGAINALAQTVKTALRDKRILLVTGVSYDKEVESIVKGLLKIADAVICTRAYHKGSPPEKIFRIVRETRPEIPAFVEPNIADATRHALDYATENKMTILIAGGLFLSIEGAHALDGRDPEELRFF